MEKKKTIKAKTNVKKAPTAIKPKATKIKSSERSEGSAGKSSGIFGVPKTQGVFKQLGTQVTKSTLDKMQEANKKEPRLEAKHPEMFTQELKIPKDRVGVLVGTKGETKRMIQKRANVRLDISSEGDVVIRGPDTIMLYDVRTIVQAIGRGFSPEKAMRLFNESNSLEIIDITLYTGKSKKKMERMRGRVIGENGRARASIEDLTETNISVYGKTVGIIGDMEMVALAREAIDMILSGAPHGATYRMVENKRREIHKRRLEAMYNK